MLGVIPQALDGPAEGPPVGGEEERRTVLQRRHEGGERAHELRAVGGDELLGEALLLRRCNPLALGRLLRGAAGQQLEGVQHVVDLLPDQLAEGDAQHGLALTPAHNPENEALKMVRRKGVGGHVLEHILHDRGVGLEDLLIGRDGRQLLALRLGHHKVAVRVHRHATAATAARRGTRLKSIAHGGNHKGHPFNGRVVAARHQRKSVLAVVLAEVRIEHDDDLELLLTVLGVLLARRLVEVRARELQVVVATEEHRTNRPPVGVVEVAHALQHLADLRDVVEHQREHLLKLLVRSVLEHELAKVDQHLGEAFAGLIAGDPLDALGKEVGVEVALGNYVRQVGHDLVGSRLVEGRIGRDVESDLGCGHFQ